MKKELKKNEEKLQTVLLWDCIEATYPKVNVDVSMDATSYFLTFAPYPGHALRLRLFQNTKIPRLSIERITTVLNDTNPTTKVHMLFLGLIPLNDKAEYDWDFITKILKNYQKIGYPLHNTEL